MMKKKRFVPQAQQHQDFNIFEISATLEDYRLAFELNKMPDMQLERGEDLMVYTDAKKVPEVYSLFFCQTENTTYYLIHSLGNSFALMKSYFLIVEGHADESWQQDLISHLEHTGDVLSVNPVETDEKKASKSSSGKKLLLVNSILTDLEYHMLEIRKKEEDQKVKLKTGTSSVVRKLYD